MAKQKLKTVDYVLIGTVAVGGIGYYLYNKGKLPFIDKLIAKIKGEAPKTPSATPTSSPETTPVVSKVITATPPVDPTKDAGYMSKVRNIQLYIGAGVDGNAGSSDTSQTNIKLKSKFPTLYSTEGRLRPTNVDKYVKAITDQQNAQKTAGTNKQRIDFANKIVNLHKQGSKIRFVSGKNEKLTLWKKDKARNILVKTTDNIMVVYNASPFDYANSFKILFDGWLLFNSKYDKDLYFQVSPNALEAL